MLPGPPGWPRLYAPVSHLGLMSQNEIYFCLCKVMKLRALAAGGYQKTTPYPYVPSRAIRFHRSWLSRLVRNWSVRRSSSAVAAQQMNLSWSNAAQQSCPVCIPARRRARCRQGLS